MTELLIARHGNTFKPDETPTRVGKKTNIPLVDSGRAQGEALGRYLKNNNLLPDYIFTSRLQRTIETAYTAMQAASHRVETTPLDIFDEIDYGPDENKIEAEVIARIGKQAIIDWDEKAIVPEGWIINPDAVIQDWKDFASNLLKHYADKTILVVTSNGTARFAPYLTGDFDSFRQNHTIKMKTGALSHLSWNGETWDVKFWNIRP